MKNFFRYFNWGLAIGALLAFFLVLCFELIFFQREEIFVGANGVGKIIYTLLLSFIAAYIFYLLTVYYKEYKTKETVRVPLNIEIEQLLKTYRSLFLSICKSAGREIENCFSSREIEVACRLLDTSTRPLNPYSGNTVKLPNNWITFLNANKDVSRETIDSILNLYIQYIDYEIIDLLNRIKRCDYFELVNIADQRKDEYREFSRFFPAMKEYIDLMQQLEELNKKLL